MCGIVGYVGDRPCRDLLIAGLEKLEYRGYDSAGVSVISDDGIDSVRAVGNLANLREAVERQSSNGSGSVAVAARPATIGLGHTRWATHGRVTEENAHPHGDCRDEIHIVLNGIIENHAELRRDLQAEGHEFTSETDAEIVSHLIERHYDGDLTEAVRKAFGELRGHYAFVAMHREQPDTLVAARKECPLIIGLGENENFIASAIPAFLAETRTALGIKNDEIVTVHKGDVTITDAEGNVQQRDPEEVTWDEDAAEKGGYDTFMLKEIHEQPDAVAETITDRLPDAGRGRPLRRRARRRLPARHRANRDRRLRDLLPLGADRPLRDRAVGAGAGRDGHRLGVPLPGAGPAAERPGHRHHPVRRDRGHPRCDAAGAGGRLQGARDHQRDGQSGDPGRRRRPLHPVGHRDQRGGDQDVRQPGGGDVPARPPPRGAPGYAVRRRGSPSSSPSSSRCPRSCRRRSSPARSR